LPEHVKQGAFVRCRKARPIGVEIEKLAELHRTRLLRKDRLMA
jgi:hypothetical protein